MLLTFSLFTFTTVEGYNAVIISTDDAVTEPVSEKSDAVFCSCVQGTRIHIPDLPRGDAVDFRPNATPGVGVAALFRYADGTAHIAPITAIEADRFHVVHYNKEKCERTEEWVAYDNPFIHGFYSTKNSPS